MRNTISGALLVTALLAVSCGASRDLELLSIGPARGRQMRLYLEHRGFASKPRLAIEMFSDNGRQHFGPAEISDAGVDGAANETFEGGICLSESAWATAEVGVFLVKNCLGHVFIVACDFGSGKLVSGDKFRDSIRNALLARYRAELKTVQQDVLVWLNSREADAAYKWRQLGNGRLM